MIDPHSPIAEYLARVTTRVDNLKNSATAQANLLTQRADDPPPLLRQLAATLRNGVGDIVFLADRAEELAADLDSREASSRS